MELERLAQRSVSAIRRVLRSAPDAPSLNPTKKPGVLSSEPQCSLEDNQLTQSPTNPIETNSALVATISSGTAIPDQTAEVIAGAPPNPVVATISTKCQNSASDNSDLLAQSSSASPSQDIKTISSATSQITNVDSSGVEGTLTSSNSSPPPEALAQSTDFVGAVIFAQKVIVAPNMRYMIDPMLLSDWETTIGVRLRNDLCALGKGSAVALDFHMAGENKQMLKLTIIITCADAKSREHNRKKVLSLKWLAGYHLKCCVVKNSDKCRYEPFTKAKEMATVLPHEVLANLGSESITLCGIQAALKDSTLFETACPFRLGGLIRVDDEFFCLTTGHVVVPSHPGTHSITTEQSQSLDTNDTTEVDGSSLIFTIGECESDDETEAISDAPEEEIQVFDPVADDDTLQGASKLDLSDLNDWTLLGDFDSYFSHEDLLASEKAISCSDWGLVKLKSKTYWRPNSVQIQEGGPRTFIEDIITEDELSPGQVWAITESGRPKPGFLSLGSAFISLYGRGFRVRQISFEETLGMWLYSPDYNFNDV